MEKERLQKQAADRETRLKLRKRRQVEESVRFNKAIRDKASTFDPDVLCGLHPQMESPSHQGACIDRAGLQT
jgi:hypothetical protein